MQFPVKLGDVEFKRACHCNVMIFFNHVNLFFKTKPHKYVVLQIKKDSNFVTRQEKKTDFMSFGGIFVLCAQTTGLMKLVPRN